jgi:hypothetical protein
MGIRSRTRIIKEEQPQMLGESIPDDSYEEVTMPDDYHGDRKIYLVSIAEVDRELKDSELGDAPLAREVARRKVASRHLGQGALGTALEVKQNFK